MPKEYKLEVKVKNNLIYSAIKELGFETIREFTKAANLSYAIVCQLICMTITPVRSNGDFRDCVYDLAKALNKIPAELFTSNQIYITEGIKKEFEIGEDEIQTYLTMIQGGEVKLLEEQVIDDEKAEKLPACINLNLDKLYVKEKKVIEMYFGLNGEDQLTENEIGIKIGVRSSRVHQIKHKALRKLRRCQYMNNSESEDLSIWLTTNK